MLRLLLKNNLTKKLKKYNKNKNKIKKLNKMMVKKIKTMYMFLEHQLRQKKSLNNMFMCLVLLKILSRMITKANSKLNKNKINNKKQ